MELITFAALSSTVIVSVIILVALLWYFVRKGEFFCK